MPRRLRNAINQATQTAAKGERTLQKADIVLDAAADLLDKLEDGISISLDVAGNKIPVVLKIELADDND